MGWVIFLIIALVIVFVMMRLAGRRGRLVGSRGYVPVKTCGECGHPRGKCQHLRRRAESATAFRGSVRKK